MLPFTRKRTAFDCQIANKHLIIAEKKNRVWITTLNGHKDSRGTSIAIIITFNNNIIENVCGICVSVKN